MSALSSPECPLGYPLSQLERELTSDQFSRLYEWLRGQTGAICDGSRYNHDTRDYEPTDCADSHHGIVAYAWDVVRYYLRGAA